MRYVATGMLFYCFTSCQSLFAQTVEAMRVRILELEQQLAAASAPPPAKRPRKSAAAADAYVPDENDATDALTPAQQKKEDKKHQAQIKKLFDR